ncbi:two-component regulator propeller domain-containing protein [Bacteroides sp.]|uniref:two-component regulator propeller domain-containing protein n=1 Tax=Bacteroides sp. TaxID=29523 RepID=UPI002A804C2F|nr:two-component regulator propeller domain-containing protein [Bacteroides sp.]
MRKFVFLFILLLLGSKMVAFDILDIVTVTDRNGLSQNTTRCMMQDSRNFIWLGTINGLNRFNGKDFTIIHPQLDGSHALSDSRIREIVEDKNGFIWVRTFSNTLFCYDPQLETMIDYAPQDSDKIFSNIKVVSNKDVWLWGKNGCCRVRYVNGKPEAWKPDNEVLAEKNILFMFEDSLHRIWIGTKEELFRVENNQVISVRKGITFWDVQEIGDEMYFVNESGLDIFSNQQSSFVSFIPITRTTKMEYVRSCLLNDGLLMLTTNRDLYLFDTKEKKLLPTESFFQGKKMLRANFIMDNKGHVWVYNKTGILWRHHSNNTFEPLNLIPSEVLSLIDQEQFMIYHDSRDIVWITTFGNGLFAIYNTGRIQHFTVGKDLPTNYLFCVTEDKSGEIWVGTELGGVVKISLSNYPFEMYYPALGDGMERGNAVRLMFEDKKGYYWFGTRDGNLYICDENYHRLSTQRIEGGLPFTMAEDTLGYKWLGTKGAGLFLFSERGDRLIEKYMLPNSAGQPSSRNNIFTVLRDNKNRMWMATFGGGLQLAERNSGKLTFRQFLFDNDHLNMMRSMIQDRDGLIWIGTNDGVVVFDPDELLRDRSKYTVLRVYSHNRQLLSYDEVKVIFEDSKGRIWMGTTGRGLHLLERKENLTQSRFKHFGGDNGLSNKTVQTILEDNYGDIWVSTESGISRFDLKKERFENFIFSNNRHPAVFNELSGWKKKTGELMFGSFNGVYTLNPSEVTFDTYAPPVMITGLWVNGTDVRPGTEDSPLKESITGTKKIVLDHNQNSFNLECTMLNFHAPEFNQYAYYLQGYEQDWNSVSRNNMATYRNVPPGTYVFKVKGCNSFGVWSELETDLEIIILPPWWKSWQAIILYIISGIIITFFVSRVVIKMHRLNMAVEIEKQLTEYKLRFFTNISHEFRTPLTIIRGAIEDLAGQEQIAPLINKQLTLLTKSSTRLLRLIDQLLEFRRLQNNKMELKLEWTEAEHFFYDIYLTFKEMAEKKKIEFLFESNEYKQKMLLDRSKMDKIAYNLLSNAFKNTPVGGKIVMRLHFSTAEDNFTLSVSDNGAGVPYEKRNMLFVRFEQIHYASDGTGVGLHLTSELAKVHKGNIAYTDSEMGGACFSVSIPLSDVNYDKADIIEENSTELSSVAKEITTDLLTPEEVTDISEASVNKPFKEYKVMVIDDDDDVRGLLETQLGNYFTVSTAANGAEGLEKLGDEQPDLVVCDVMMPEMDGFELTKRLKGNFNISHIPVILLTAYSSEEHQLKGIRAGADSYITKPFSVKYLLMRIVKLIEQREKLQRKFATEPGALQPFINTTDRDRAFMDKLDAVIQKNMGDAEFKLETYASTIGIGRTTFYGKLKSIVGCAPSEYVRILRMKKAAELLLTTDLNIAEIGFQVGINDPFYFSRCFKKSFGKSPLQYRKEPIKRETDNDMKS